VPLIKIHDGDNVAVALEEVIKGSELFLGATTLIARDDVATGHKIALVDLERGQNVINRSRHRKCTGRSMAA